MSVLGDGALDRSKATWVAGPDAHRGSERLFGQPAIDLHERREHHCGAL
jgi:hypothetical protein